MHLFVLVADRYINTLKSSNNCSYIIKTHIIINTNIAVIINQ